jgi:hypothetical protein
MVDKPKKQKPKNTKSISYNYDATGYLVQLCDAGEIVDEYRGGNSPYDSAASLPVDATDAVPLAEIKNLARTEVLRLAEEYGIPKRRIEIDEDIVVSETESDSVGKETARRDALNQIGRKVSIVDCKLCGVTATDFINSAGEYLSNNDGKEADDPGYFD